MLANFFRLVGSFYFMLFVPKNPKLAYLVCTLSLVASYIFFILIYLVPSLAHFFMSLSFVGIGIARSGLPLPYMLAYRNLNKPEDVMALSIWQGVVIFGFVMVYLYDSLMR